MITPGLVDSHLHLQSYGPETDVAAVVEQALAVGVSHFIVNGTSPADWETVLELAGKFPQVVPCLGLHPWFVETDENWREVLEDLLKTNMCGVGEVGLDRAVEIYDEAVQVEASRYQLGLARKYNRPVMVHCVKAWGLLMDILDTESLPQGMLIHAYGGSADMVKPLVKKGAYFTFSGSVLSDRFKRAREALKTVPLDRLLVESDAPYMLPPEEFCKFTLVAKDGSKANHPANLPAILEGMADLLGVPLEQLRKQIWENSQRFFGSIIRS
jgi:TatD DNase family protein